MYKFRCWDNNEYHQNVLFKRELYFASVDQFNDPFDSSLPYIIDQEDLKDHIIFDKYRNLFKTMYPDLSESEIHKLAFKEQKENRLNDEDHLKFVSDYFRDYVKREYGVLSMSKNEKNFLLWSHYADSHSGYCIGFDRDKLYKDLPGWLGPIKYQEDFPLHNLEEENGEFLSKLLFVKSNNWVYEEEYRLAISGNARKTCVFNKESLSEVIFGCKMLHQTKIEILGFIKKEYPNINVFEMSLNKQEFTLDKMKLR